MRTVLGLILAVILIYPGVEALRWLMVDVTGVYDDMTLTEAFLGMIVVLLCVLAVRGIRIGGGQEAQSGQGLSGGRVELRPQRLGGRVPRRRPAAQPTSARPKARTKRTRAEDTDEPPPSRRTPRRRGN